MTTALMWNHSNSNNKKTRTSTIARRITILIIIAEAIAATEAIKAVAVANTGRVMAAKKS